MGWEEEEGEGKGFSSEKELQSTTQDSLQGKGMGARGQLWTSSGGWGKGEEEGE